MDSLKKTTLSIKTTDRVTTQDTLERMTLTVLSAAAFAFSLVIKLSLSQKRAVIGL